MDKKSKSSQRGKKGGQVASTQPTSGGLNPLAGAAMGAVAGAAVGAAAAVALSDKNTQRKVGEVVDTMRGKATETVQNLTQKAQDALSQTSGKMEKAKEDMKSAIPKKE